MPLEVDKAGPKVVDQVDDRVFKNVKLEVRLHKVAARYLNICWSSSLLASVACHVKPVHFLTSCVVEDVYNRLGIGNKQELVGLGLLLLVLKELLCVHLVDKSNGLALRQGESLTMIEHPALLDWNLLSQVVLFELIFEVSVLPREHFASLGCEERNVNFIYP